MMTTVTTLSAATERLLTTAASLSDDAWAAPSLCAGWSRAHVLAHLALNAEGLGGILRGIRDGVPRTMYVSEERRDGDIDDLVATAGPAAILDRLRSAVAGLAEVVDVATVLPEGTTFERTPGGRQMSANNVPFLRLREVEIHHADLGAGYTASDWPPTTALSFVTASSRQYRGTGFHAVATDEPARWTFGTPADGAATVSGPVGPLAWWATGRDADGAVTSSTGALPDLTSA